MDRHTEKRTPMLQSQEVGEMFLARFDSCLVLFYTFYVNVQYLLNYKAYNHQTLHSASPQCTDSAGTLTG